MGETKTEYHYSKSIPYTNKTVEFQKFRDKDNKNDSSDSESRLKSYILSYTRRKKIDHAGFRFEFESPNSNYLFSFHDERHWNQEEERWYKEGEQIRQYLESVSDDHYKTRYLDDWIDRYNLRDEMKSEFGHTSLYTVLDSLRERDVENPYIEVFERLFPKIKNRKS